MLSVPPEFWKTIITLPFKGNRRGGRRQEARPGLGRRPSCFLPASAGLIITASSGPTPMDLQLRSTLGGRQNETGRTLMLCQHGNGLITRHAALTPKRLPAAMRPARCPPPGDAERVGRRKSKTRQRPGQCLGDMQGFAIAANPRYTSRGWPPIWTAR